MAGVSMSIPTRKKCDRHRIALASQHRLDEARDRADDWTGKADAKERRRLQNRLHQRAWRRRKAEETGQIAHTRSYRSQDTACSEPEHQSVTLAFERATAALVGSSANSFGRESESKMEVRSVGAGVGSKGWSDGHEWSSFCEATAATLQAPAACTTVQASTTSQALLAPSLGRTPLNIIDLMSMNLHAVSRAVPSSLSSSAAPSDSINPSQHPKLIPPLIPYTNHPSPTTLRFTFPLSPDHYLITLIQFNVFRAILTNLCLCSLTSTLPPECTMALTLISLLPTPSSPPPSFMPTATQLSIPHPDWIDSIPCSKFRDNLILNQGRYDEDALCEDVCGGLYEGFDDTEQRGLMVWGEPWEVGSWEVSRGFEVRWGWLLEGCREMWDVTRERRRARGEE